jgi:hypothetical protein
MRAILRSGELWGGPPFNSDIPAVQAYAGELPPEANGFEFFAAAPPDAPFGPVMFWRVRADGRVWGDDAWARIVVLITKVQQEF